MFPCAIQEKQRVVARQQQLRTGKASKTISTNQVAFERTKAPDGGIFIFNSDCEMAANQTPPRGCYVITATTRNKAHGEFIGQLKQFCIADSNNDIPKDLFY